MVSKTTTASKGGDCLSVFGQLYRTFAMSIFVPALWSRWPQSALQTPFALSNYCSCCILHGLDTRGLRYDRVPPPSLCAVSCSRTAQPREENYVGINAAGSLFLAVVLMSGWRVLIGVVQTVSRSGERCPPPGQDGCILRERYSRCRDRSHLEMQQNQ